MDERERDIRIKSDHDLTLINKKAYGESIFSFKSWQSGDDVEAVQPVELGIYKSTKRIDNPVYVHSRFPGDDGESVDRRYIFIHSFTKQDQDNEDITVKDITVKSYLPLLSEILNKRERPFFNYLYNCSGDISRDFLCLQNCDIFDTNNEGELTFAPTIKKYCKQGTEFYSELTADCEGTTCGISGGMKNKSNKNKKTKTKQKRKKS